MESRRLPNGELISEINSYETEYVYQEVFERNVYFRHGINVKPHGIVFDVGANIGLFSLQTARTYPTARVFAFEPVPQAFACLMRNTAKYGDRIISKNLALTERRGWAELRVYPNYTVISGLQADLKRDCHIISSGMVNSIMSEEQMLQDPREVTRIRKLVHDRLSTSSVVKCQTDRISNLIDEDQLRALDLVKIDAERSEAQIIRGVDEHHWSIIRQVVLEVHEVNKIEFFRYFFAVRGYAVVIEEDPLLSGIYTLYAKQYEK